MANKRTTTKSSPTPKPKDERKTRPVWRWRKTEWVALAKEVGVTTDKKTTEQLRLELESLKKNGKIKPELIPEEKQGGVRENAGRKPIEQTERAIVFQEIARNHAEEQVTHTFQDSNGKTVTVTKSRNEFLLDRLYDMGFKEKNIKAVDLYYNRAHGKALQPVHHSGQINAPQQMLDSQEEDAIMKALDAYEENI